MAFVREEQKKAEVEVSQAPILLHSHLAAIITHMALRIRCTHDPYDRIFLARDIALFTLAFSTTKRGDGLSRTLIQRILRLPNECGFLFNVQWGKTARDVADHLVTVEDDTKRVTTCSVRVVEQYIAVAIALDWNMTQGYLLPRISRRPNTGTLTRGKIAHIGTRYNKGAKSARAERRETHRVYHALLQIRRSTNTGVSRRGPASGNATRILEETKYSLKILQTHGSTVPRIL